MKKKELYIIIFILAILTIILISANYHIFKNYSNVEIEEETFNKYYQAYRGWENDYESANIFLLDFQVSKLNNLIDELNEKAVIDSFLETANYGNKQSDKIEKAIVNFKQGKTNELGIYLRYKDISEMLVLSQLPPDVIDTDMETPFKNGITVTFRPQIIRDSDEPEARRKLNDVFKSVMIISDVVKPKDIKAQFRHNRGTLDIVKDTDCSLL